MKLLNYIHEVKGIYGYRRMTMNINRILDSNYNHKRIYRLNEICKSYSLLFGEKEKNIFKAHHRLLLKIY